MKDLVDLLKHIRTVRPHHSYSYTRTCEHEERVFEVRVLGDRTEIKDLRRNVLPGIGLPVLGGWALLLVVAI